MKIINKRHIPFVAALLLAAASLSAMTTVPGLTGSLSRGASDSTSHDSTAKEEAPIPESSVIDEVVWVVGDEPILKSDVEMMRMQGQQEGMTWGGNPDCAIPEQLAVQKLFLHQAEIDSIEVSESEIAAGVQQQLNRWIEIAGSQEKLEEYRKESINEIRNDMHDEFKNVQVIQVSPKIKQSEINRVKDELRGFTDRINNGETSFSTLARLYSEDPGSARQGGELGFMGRGMLDPAFAQVAFNLTDPKKVSKIVESEFGYHIIQLIDKRGDKINVRHILLRPKVAQDDIDAAEHRLDSIRTDIVNGKFTFEAGASYISDDKDTKNNQGLMSNSTSDGMTSRFQMKELPTEIARVVDTMKVGEISAPFTRINNKNKTVACIIKLKSRVEGHRATITEDFQVMKDVVLAKEREQGQRPL